MGKRAMTRHKTPLKPALTSVEDLLQAGLAQAGDAANLHAVADDFRIRISAEMAGVTSPAIAAQFVPTAAELTPHAGEMTDPIGDNVFSPTAGLTHRYPDRVILAATHACEVYCRFCFRREVVGEAAALPEDDLDRRAGLYRRHPCDLGGDLDGR
ncbi:MAG: hypothetical protein U5N55_09490 [Cypionkella sp.]|nr:hypothetical protein [Cypionkella sp.]